MKKAVFAIALASACLSLVTVPALRAQAANQNIQIQDPAEFNAYQNATSQTDPNTKASALESFLTQYPQSVVKKLVLDSLIDTYSQANAPDKMVSAATRLLQVDPNNMKAIYASVVVKKTMCQKSVDASGAASDAQTCDDAAALAQKGLTAPKPDGMADADWKNLTTGAYPIFHSAIAYDDLVSKKDYASAIKEYTAELMLFPPDQCSKPGQCLLDTLQLAQAYTKPGDSHDVVKALWFYARFVDFAPPNFKAQVEPGFEYWYKRYHGKMDGDIDAIKTQAQATLFPPATFSVKPAPTPADMAHDALTQNDPAKLNLEDKEFILANGNKDDADKLWAILKDQQTPVPGAVISAPATSLVISATTAAAVKPKDYVVKLNTPGACASVPPPPSELKIKDVQAYILANGVKADTDALGDVLTDSPAKFKKLTVDPGVSAINVAVTQDAKDGQKADFTVNLKTPVACKDAPAVGSALALQPAMELDGTYDTYTQVPASGSTPASAQIVLRDGFVQQESKKAPVHHTAAKPAAGHHAQ